MCKKYRYRFLWWRPSERTVDSVTPELHAHGSDGGIADVVCDPGDVDVEGADREIGISRRGRDERLKYIGRGIEVSARIRQLER
jgi:hypothetical protein